MWIPSHLPKQKLRGIFSFNETDFSRMVQLISSIRIDLEFDAGSISHKIEIDVHSIAITS